MRDDGQPSVDELDLAAAYVVVVAALAILGIGDVWLVRKEKGLVTHVLRTPAGLAFLSILLLHVLDVLGPIDPFKAIGRLLRRL